MKYLVQSMVLCSQTAFPIFLCGGRPHKEKWGKAVWQHERDRDFTCVPSLYGYRDLAVFSLCIGSCGLQ